MKKINDENIVKYVKDNQNYNIKTTSQNILNQYQYEMKLEAQKAPKKSKKKAIALGSIFGSLGLASAALIAVIVVGLTPDNNDTSLNKDSIDYIPNLNPSNSEGLKKQLVTFSAFSPASETSKINLHQLFKANNILKESDDDDDEKETNLVSKEIVKETVSLYEEVEQSVSYLYNDSLVTIEEKEATNKFNNDTYLFVSEFYFNKKENSEPFAYYYFNKNDLAIEDGEKEVKSNAYYKTLNQEFKVEVEEKVEVSSEENERETTLVLRDAKGLDPKIYLIAKENETEKEDGQISTEDSLKIETYANEDAFKNEKYLRKVATETEFEGHKNKMSVKIKDSKSEVKYKINKVTENKLELNISYEKFDDDIEYKDISIILEYLNDLRTYSWNGEIIDSFN